LANYKQLKKKIHLHSDLKMGQHCVWSRTQTLHEVAKRICLKTWKNGIFFKALKISFKKYDNLDTTKLTCDMFKNLTHHIFANKVSNASFKKFNVMFHHSLIANLAMFPTSQIFHYFISFTISLSFITISKSPPHGFVPFFYMKAKIKNTNKWRKNNNNTIKIK
jgi:hypothetical protein